MTKLIKNLKAKLGSTAKSKFTRAQEYKTIFSSQQHHNQNAVFVQVHGFGQPLQSQAKANSGI